VERRSAPAPSVTAHTPADMAWLPDGCLLRSCLKSRRNTPTPSPPPRRGQGKFPERVFGAAKRPPNTRN
jgi:hypothetical protein